MRVFFFFFLFRGFIKKLWFSGIMSSLLQVWLLLDMKDLFKPSLELEVCLKLVVLMAVLCFGDVVCL